MSDKNMKNRPKKRFPEFANSGEWEEKMLSEVAELTSSKRVHLSDYTDSGVPFFRGKEISILKNNQIPDDILYISEEHYEEIKKRYGVPEVGDILITAVGTLGNVYRVQDSNRFYFKDGNLIWMRHIVEDSNFLEILLDVKNEMILSSAIGSSQKALTMVALNKLKFRFPNPNEQQKIANCLSSVDSLILAQSQKVELLKKHKKGLLQNLFPKDGENVPQLRFPEFVNDGEWEEKTLQKISNFVNKKVSLSSLNPKKYISTENILQDFAGLKETNTLPPTGSATGFLVGDILVSNIRPYLKKICVSEFDGGASNDVLVIRAAENINQNFLSFNLKNDAFIDFVMAGAKGVKMPRGDITLIKQYPVFIPQNRNEQQKIADCLSSLDEQITQQTTKLQTLKEHKKGLMQQLFPNSEAING